jgi:DNA-binding NtrC family response regulator
MKRILVVDDNRELQWLYREAAGGPGRTVTTAGSMDEALTAIAGETFDVVVADLRMESRLTGLEVLKAAKRKDRGTQVIVVTVYATPEVSVEAMKEGAFDFLPRNSPAIDFPKMLEFKIDLALEFRAALLAAATSRASA